MEFLFPSRSVQLQLSGEVSDRVLQQLRSSVPKYIKSEYVISQTSPTCLQIDGKDAIKIEESLRGVLHAATLTILRYMSF